MPLYMLSAQSTCAAEVCMSVHNSCTGHQRCEFESVRAFTCFLHGPPPLHAICAACLYMACRQNNVPRSFKEITAVMPAEVSVAALFVSMVQCIKGGAQVPSCTELA
eukprot:1140190-Pelagomonas_calceolata.AAC.5